MAKPPGFLTRTMTRLLSRFDAWRFRRTGGKALGLGKHPQLLLTTVGRKSGREHTVALFFTRVEDRLAVIASYGGADVHPAWWLNLQAAERGRVEVGGEAFDVRPVVLAGEEREQAWQAMAAFWPAYNSYAQKTTREIPVVALERTT